MVDFAWMPAPAPYGLAAGTRFVLPYGPAWLLPAFPPLATFFRVFAAVVLCGCLLLWLCGRPPAPEAWAGLCFGSYWQTWLMVFVLMLFTAGIYALTCYEGDVRTDSMSLSFSFVPVPVMVTSSSP